eukprot:1677676-Pyramimonas_sp.AAC.1
MRMVMGRSRHFGRRPFTSVLPRDGNYQNRVMGDSLFGRPVFGTSHKKHASPPVALTCVLRA